MPQSSELSRIQSHQYPAAHLGHLTEAQQSALDDFKILCEEKGYYKPEGSDGQEAASHDDETMLRYLRARRFETQPAWVQFKDTEDWRKSNRLDELYETINVEEYDQTRRLYPQWTGRRDKRGIPVYVFEVAPLNSKAMAAYEKSIATTKGSTGGDDSRKAPVKMLRLFALYENLLRFVMPLCSAVPDRPHPETPISQSNNIVDISRVGLKQFWNLKSHMQDASTLATAHYPETLDRIFIIGAPSFFPTVWSWIKRWFDPITVSKIFILSSSNMKSVLETYIDPSNIPKKYGGTLDFNFGDMPILEPGITSHLVWGEDGNSRPSAQDQETEQQKQAAAIDPANPAAPTDRTGAPTIPTGPIQWEDGPNGSLVAVAVGSEKGKPRRRIVATLPHPVRSGLQPGVNTEIDESKQTLYAWGTETQPTEEEGENAEVEPPSDESENGGAEKEKQEQVQEQVQEQEQGGKKEESGNGTAVVANGKVDEEKQAAAQTQAQEVKV